jgi:hypothetical protein
MRVALDKRVPIVVDTEQWRASTLRHRHAELLARRAQVTAQAQRAGWPPISAFVLGLLFLIGITSSLTLVLFTSPEVPMFRMSFLLTSGLGIWGLVGLAALAMRRDAQRQKFALAVADSFRQGLLAAACIELNLATRMLDLWTPMLSIVLVIVFTGFEVITVAKRAPGGLEP